MTAEQSTLSQISDEELMRELEASIKQDSTDDSVLDDIDKTIDPGDQSRLLDLLMKTEEKRFDMRSETNEQLKALVGVGTTLCEIFSELNITIQRALNEMARTAAESIDEKQSQKSSKS